MGNAHKSQHGAILVLVIISMVAILSIVALVFDIGRATTAVEQGKQYSRLAALAAIEEYFDALRIAGVSDQKAYERALERTQKMAINNTLLGDSNSKPNITEGGTGAILEPGFWKTDKACPVATKPCFIPTTKAKLGFDSRANAFKVSGEFYSTGLFSSFARILGAHAFKVRASAVATILPRHAVFLVDNSRSMVQETHPIETTYIDEHPQIEGSDYGFPSPVTISTLHDELWKWMQANALNRPANETENPHKQKHYVNDYSSFVLLGDDSYGNLGVNVPLPAAAGGGKEFIKLKEMHPDPKVRTSFSTKAYTGDTKDFRYSMDAFRHPKYQGPEPLRTVFAGLLEAVKTFEERQVAGDKVSIIFYDNTLTWPRVINLTNKFGYLKALTDFEMKPTSLGFPSLLQSDPTKKTTVENEDLEKLGLELITRFGLFPFWNGNTDTTLAIREALYQLEKERKDSKIQSSDFIVLFGDGMATCHSTSVPRCSNSHSYFLKAMDEIKQQILQKDGIAEQDIPMHYIAMGSHIQPHTVDHVQPGGGCYSDVDWRSSAATLPTGTSVFDFASNANNNTVTFANADETTPFYAANRYMYEFSILTSGMYAPIRPARAKVDGVCEPIKCGDASDPDLAIVNGQYLRVRDPSCKEPLDQVKDYVKQMIGDNPFTIVEVS